LALSCRYVLPQTAASKHTYFQHDVLNYKSACPADEGLTLIKQMLNCYINPQGRTTWCKSSKITHFIRSCPLFFKLLADSIKTPVLARASVSQGVSHGILTIRSLSGRCQVAVRSLSGRCQVGWWDFARRLTPYPSHDSLNHPTLLLQL